MSIIYDNTIKVLFHHSIHLLKWYWCIIFNKGTQWANKSENLALRYYSIYVVWYLLHLFQYLLHLLYNSEAWNCQMRYVNSLIEVLLPSQMCPSPWLYFRKSHLFPPRIGYFHNFPQCVICIYLFDDLSPLVSEFRERTADSPVA